MDDCVGLGRLTVDCVRSEYDSDSDSESTSRRGLYRDDDDGWKLEDALTFD